MCCGISILYPRQCYGEHGKSLGNWEKIVKTDKHHIDENTMVLSNPNTNWSTSRANCAGLSHIACFLSGSLIRKLLSKTFQELSQFSTQGNRL